VNRQLTVHNAQISTAAVEIKTLTISGKQVTIAVFRQLREERLISFDGTLNGVPWGTVNYHPDKCGDDFADHIHVVWQRGSELLRSRVGRPHRLPFIVVTDSLAREWLDASILAGWRAETHTDRPGALFLDLEMGAPVRIEVDTKARDAMWSLSDRDRDSALKSIRLRATGKSVEDLSALMQAEARGDAEARTRVEGHWKALNDLPQLFIAV
jgi:hypothetical protein